jgi:hypothetical protein
MRSAAPRDPPRPSRRVGHRGSGSAGKGVRGSPSVGLESDMAHPIGSQVDLGAPWPGLRSRQRAATTFVQLTPRRAWPSMPIATGDIVVSDAEGAAGQMPGSQDAEHVNPETRGRRSQSSPQARVVNGPPLTASERVSDRGLPGLVSAGIPWEPRITSEAIDDDRRTEEGPL